MKKFSIKLISIFLLSMISISVSARTVKVGYIKDSHNFMSGLSEEDPKFGYAYEYLQTIASHTGWKYEYVYGYWEELFKKLQNGEIDILTDVSYTPEQAKELLYANVPMATESYYLYAQRYDNSINPTDLSTLNGKSIALGKGVYHYNLFLDWLKSKNINLNITEKNYDDVSAADFNAGLYDLYLAIDVDMTDEIKWEPIAKIGSSDIYFAVAKSKPEILDELNSALNDIFMTNSSYNTSLWSKYFSDAIRTTRLTEKENEWLQNHETIKIGCLKDDVPFAYQDDHGVTTGLVSYLMESLWNTFLVTNRFEYDFFDNYEELDKALQTKEVDVVFPVVYDLYELENRNLIATKPVTSATMSYAYINFSDTAFMNKIALVSGKHSEAFVKHYFSNADRIFHETPEECLDKILKGDVHGAILSSAELQNTIFGRKKYNQIKTIELPQAEAVSCVLLRENFIFATILNKVICSLQDSEINSATINYSTKSNKYTFCNFLEDYRKIIIAVILIFIAITIALITSLERLKTVINYDVLTHLLNRRRLAPYMKNALFRAKEKNEKFSVLIFDLDNFKKVNDTYGHACGDEILKMAANTISKGIKRTDYAFRWGGEEFMVLLKAEKDIAVKAAERIRKEIEDQIVEYNNQKIKMTTTVGVSEYTEGATSESIFAIADANLYKGKKNGKNQVVS